MTWLHLLTELTPHPVSNIVEIVQEGSNFIIVNGRGVHIHNLSSAKSMKEGKEVIKLFSIYFLSQNKLA